MTQTDTRTEQEQVTTGSRVIINAEQRFNTAPSQVASIDTSPNLSGVLPSVIEQSNMEQLTALIQQVVHATIDEIGTTANDDNDDDWSLTVEQVFFMFAHNNLIEAAFAGVEDENEYTQALHDLAASDEFTALFGEMSFDEAYDRYTTMLEEGRA